MSHILFDGLAFTCAGALCALLGDVQKQVNAGLMAFLALGLVIWGRFFAQVFSSDELWSAAAVFLISQGLSTLSYLATVYFLEPVGVAAASRD